jgi:hypothetical protein
MVFKKVKLTTVVTNTRYYPAPPKALSRIIRKKS